MAPARENFYRFLKTKYKTPDAVAHPLATAGGFQDLGRRSFSRSRHLSGLERNGDRSDRPLEDQLRRPLQRPVRPARSGRFRLGEVQAPGHAIVRALPRKPAVFRRHLTIDPAWRAAHPRVWLYLLDLNDTRGKTPTSLVHVFVNGQAIPENPPFRVESHWAMPEVTSALKDGDNLITVCLPQALFDYRVYLSGEAPRVYPAPGGSLNALWADFSDWTAWSRGQAVRRGVQMIRQIDPDRPITLMSPDVYMGPIKEVAEDYGGIFHDTGGMAGSWGDMHPVMSQSMGSPSDCEPGSGAVDLDDFKRFMGRWLTEGTQGVDYFIHIGDILWKPAVKDYFTQTPACGICSENTMFRRRNWR